jgi:hypothetical protein
MPCDGAAYDGVARTGAADAIAHHLQCLLGALHLLLGIAQADVVGLHLAALITPLSANGLLRSKVICAFC